tara:strand:- start:565 stop:990 length:426 start_codon:yes stop_codon:yes gene_type:complete
MREFSKETTELLSAVGGDRTKFLSPSTASADRMTPGDIIIFRYYLGVGPGSKGQRTALIVKSRRGDGSFPGKTGTLVSCFKLNGGSDEVINAILENLYKKRRRASYYGKIKDSLIAILGMDSYRTYKLNQMKSIWKVQLGT